MRAILTFHSVDDSGSVLSYPPKTFNKLLDAFERCGIPILELDTLLRPDTPSGVALTFDDGIANGVHRGSANPSQSFSAGSSFSDDRLRGHDQSLAKPATINPGFRDVAVVGD